jgi:hypothetical protein
LGYVKVSSISKTTLEINKAQLAWWQQDFDLKLQLRLWKNI